MEFIETFSYVIQYKQGKENDVAHALSRRYVILTSLGTKLLEFEYVKDMYANEPIFLIYMNHMIKTVWGLMGHLGKTLEILGEHFYSPKMKIDVNRVSSRCITCKKAKSNVLPQGLYITLSVPSEHWVAISMDFILGLPRTKKDKIRYLW
ncbi:uncharacterized protein LOC111389344 [Olea europaea var. sylvestris]|uniref:uncharacterized protein LOC111389344 n=1 Tax=Olea europaea var. sylvestris TaxID=158386 RepID=UPI000C1D561E|nr:uncharacterized protein LOC111389344 [Olea europaea var. sylvestris]